jgi:hypothetical protein
VQALLGSHEALVLLFDTPEFKPTVAEETFIWVVTKTNMRRATREQDQTGHRLACRAGTDPDPAPSPTEADDGLLTASEIATGARRR